MTSSKNKMLIFIVLVGLGVVVFFGLQASSFLSNESSPEEKEDVQQLDEPNNVEQSEEQLRLQAIQQKVEEWVQELTLEEKVGQMLMPQIEMINGQLTTEMNDQLQSLIQDLHLGGVILFEKNIEGIEQIVTFNAELQETSPKIPLFIAIDQEGGKVKRIPNGTNMPGNMALGATADRELAYEVGRVLGTELHALGVNVNFAPSLDVNNNPSNPVIGVRSFGEDPELVARLGNSYIQGLQDAKVIATAKHFPGHGDTDVDSHLGLPMLDHDRERLEEIELYPFRQALEQGMDMIMTAHVTFPRLDHTQVISKKDGTSITLPATLSYRILTELLREELGFQGVIVTDAFTMKAISDHFGEEEAVIQSIQAGADIILMPRNPSQAFDRILQEIEAGGLTEERIDESVRRILLLKAKNELLPGLHEERVQSPDLETRVAYAEQLLGNKEHRFIEQEVSSRAVTLVKNEDHHLPFQLGEQEKLLIIAPNAGIAERFEEAVDELLALEAEEEAAKQNGEDDNAQDGNEPTGGHNGEDAERRKWSGDLRTIIFSASIAEQEWQEAIKWADYVVLASHSLSQLATDDPSVNAFKQLIAFLHEQGRQYAWLAVDTPYDLLVEPNAKAYLAVYGAQPPNIRAGLKVVFGWQQPAGELPVTIPRSKQDIDLGGQNGGEGILYPAGTGRKQY